MMKKIKAIFGCIMAFVYVLLIQGIVVLISSVIYGVVQGAILGIQGLGAEEITIEVQNMMTGNVILIFQSLASLVCVVVFGLWYYKKLAKKNRPDLKKVFEGKTMLWITLLAIGMQLLIMIIMSLLIPMLPNMFAEYDEHMEWLGIGGSLISFIYVGFIAPISEEFIFRGVIFNKGKKVLPFMLANILQALLFGIMHGNIVQGTYAFALGIVMGILYERRQSILAPIALHMVINLFGILFATVPESFLETYKFAEIILLLIPIPAIVISLIHLNRNPVIMEEPEEPEEPEEAEEEICEKL
ncbi:MAG TPA: CPBP family intramembrane metalloprotease [Epulopiscium sp.]|nr:CPBP family intramembrane metalloprotease [Candidatus Epulonipiscium sp.]